MINIIIDNQDIYSEYGVTFAKNGFSGLLGIPAFKQLEITDWPDEDGIEVDLSSPLLGPHTFQLSFVYVDPEKAMAFYEFIMGAETHVICVNALGVEMTVRCLNSGKLNCKLKAIGELSLTFVRDEVVLTQPSFPSTSKVSQRGYYLDSVDLSSYGIWVLQGSDESLKKPAAMKENIIINSKSAAGQTSMGYSHEEEGEIVPDVHIKSKDVTLNLLINAPSDKFIAGYSRFFYDLTRPALRTFTTPFGGPSNCYYKSSSVRILEILNGASPRIWCEFSVVLCFVDGK